MQKGKIYKHGGWWMFRYKTPVMVGNRKVWKDEYVKLARADEYISAAAVEKDGHVKPYREILDSSRLTASTMQAVAEFVEDVYFPEKKTKKVLKASTLFGYRHIFDRHVKPRLNGKRLCDFKLQTAQEFLETVAAETVLSANSLRHIKWFCVAVFDFAKQKGAYNDANPFSEVKIPKAQRSSKPTRYATLDNVLDMIDVLPEPAATVVAVAAFAGLRKSEIQGLKWEDLRNGELHIERAAWRTTTIEETKTEASNSPVPVIKELAQHLEAHRDGLRASGFIFTGQKLAGPLDLHNLANRVVRPALKKARVDWCGWHGFRRGLSTNLKTLGVDDMVIQRILRHADVTVTQRSYIKIEDSVKTAAMKKLQRALNAKRRSRNHQKKAT